MKVYLVYVSDIKWDVEDDLDCLLPSQLDLTEIIVYKGYTLDEEIKKYLVEKYDENVLSFSYEIAKIF